MKKFLIIAALLTSCQTAVPPAPVAPVSPYDGKCYVGQPAPGQLVIVKVVGKTLDGNKYSVAAFQPQAGTYGEGEVPAVQVENDIISGGLREMPCPKNDKDQSDLFTAWHKEYSDFKAKMEPKKAEEPQASLERLHGSTKY